MSLADQGTSKNKETQPQTEMTNKASDVKIKTTEPTETPIEAVEGDEQCGNCMMRVRNLNKHINYNKCKNLPYPHTKKTAKKSLEQERIWADLGGISQEDPAPL